MEEIQRSLGVWDYVVFGCLFLISACIGIFFALVSRKKKNDSDDYLMGGRQMHAVPVAFSLSAGYLSAITMIGVPSEFYVYGSMFAYFCVSYFIVAVVTSEIYIPLYYRHGITSTYEYLELRFNKYVRLMATTVFVLNQVFYNGIVIYAPALALNQVTGLDLWISIAVTGVVCTFYTALGGLKAVIWTDVFQYIVMGIGFIAVVIQGNIALGGFQNVWRIAESRGRTDFAHFEGDPRIRHTFWSILVGGTMVWTAAYCTTHTVVQRILCCKTETHAKVAMYLNSFASMAITILAGLGGLTMFAYYANCDPYDAGWVSATDQLLPYFVMDILYAYPGLPGVFMCSVFSGTLSTVSSGINAVATVTVEDFIKPYKKLTDAQTLWISKALVVFYGACCLAMASMGSSLGSLVTAILSINGMISGPTLALFTMGWAFPWCNSWGAALGFISGLATSMWCYVGSTIYPPPNKYLRALDRSTVDCVFPNVTDATTRAFTTDSSQTSTEANRPPIADMYSISYLYYGVFGFVVALIVGHIVSFLTGYQKPSELPPGVTIPFFDHWIFKWLSEKTRRFLWCGVPYDKHEKEKIMEIAFFKTDGNDNKAYKNEQDVSIANEITSF